MEALASAAGHWLVLTGCRKGAAPPCRRTAGGLLRSWRSWAGCAWSRQRGGGVVGPRGPARHRATTPVIDAVATNNVHYATPADPAWPRSAGRRPKPSWKGGCPGPGGLVAGGGRAGAALRPLARSGGPRCRAGPGLRRPAPGGAACSDFPVPDGTLTSRATKSPGDGGGERGRATARRGCPAGARSRTSWRSGGWGPPATSWWSGTSPRSAAASTSTARGEARRPTSRLLRPRGHFNVDAVDLGCSSSASSPCAPPSAWPLKPGAVRRRPAASAIDGHRHLHQLLLEERHPERPSQDRLE